MSPIRALTSVLSPAGERGRLSVLIFHRVLSRRDPIFPNEVDAAKFDQMMGWVKNWFNVLPLHEAVRRLTTSTLPSRAAAISFDDGYADNYSVALPILKRHGLPATIFVATGFLDGGRMWNDTVIESVRASSLQLLDLSSEGLGNHPIASYAQKREAIGAIIGQIKYLPVDRRSEMTAKIAQFAQVSPPDDLMMTSAQVRDVFRAGMQIGAHTVSHPILAKLDLSQARREIVDGKTQLEELLSQRIGLFAYPNGKPGTDYLPEHPTLVREIGFDAAMSTAWGAADRSTDLFQMPRFTPWDRTKLRFGLRLARNLKN